MSKPESKQSSDNSLLGDMNAEDFRRYGYELIDWISEYLSHPEQHAVLSRVRPGEFQSQIPSSPPAAGESMNAVIQDVDKLIAPYLT